MFFETKGKRVEFERSVRQAHRKLKKNFFRWLVTDRPQNLLTGPLIYGMEIPHDAELRNHERREATERKGSKAWRMHRRFVARRRV